MKNIYISLLTCFNKLLSTISFDLSTQRYILEGWGNMIGGKCSNGLGSVAVGIDG